MTYISFIKNLLFILFSILNAGVIVSQTSEIDLHKKYWYYKSRFNNDFISIGTNPGQSIPFNQRGFNDSYTFTTPSDVLKTGDGTVQLGIYIAVLATEYKLLKNNSADINSINKVKYELFCALNAINRLDYYAEKIIGDNPHPKNPHTTNSPNLNGFFVRDDIHEGFVQTHYPELNYYNYATGYNGIGPIPNTTNGDYGFTQLISLGTSGVLKTSSSYQSFYSSNNPEWNSTHLPHVPGLLEGMEESQDQLYYLLMGTALVSKLVDSGETAGSNAFLYGAGNSDIRQEAINISDRLIKHLSSSAGNLWTIRNPANENAFVQVGHDAQSYSYPLDNIGCFIKYGQDFPSYVIGQPYLFNSCTDYRNLSSSSPLVWNHLSQVLNGGPTVDMQGFYHAVMGVCNCSLENRNFLNTTVQAAIQAAQDAMNNAVQSIVNNINSILGNYGNFVPQFVKNIINGMYNSINNIINTTQTLITQLSSQLISPIKVNTTEERLIYNNYSHSVFYSDCSDQLTPHVGSEEYFGIFLRKILHPNQTSLPSYLQQIVTSITPITYSSVKNNLKYILDAAPCEGNYNFYPIARPGPEWSNPNRIDRMDPTYRYNTTCQTGFLGEYHGLDYMLLHNLYYLTEGTTSFVNYSDRNITFNLPVGNNFTTSNKNTLGAYEYIVANNIINSNAAVEYRAGKEITLMPNFSVAPGADFTARIDPYVCGSNNLYNGEMLRTNGQNQEYEDKSKPEKSVKKSIDHYDEFLNSEQEELLSNFKGQLDTMIKTSDYRLLGLESKIEVYPNPNEGNFNIAFNLKNTDNVSLTIQDIMGRIVFTQKYIVGFYILPLNLSHLSKGIYLAHFENSNNEVFSKKITIN